jgi:hypothetical protein
VISGVAISIFAGGQVYFLWRTRDETQRAADAARDNAAAAASSLEFQKQSVEANRANLLIARDAAAAAQKSADVGERALVDMQRPHLILEKLTMHGYKARLPGEEESIKALPGVQKITFPRALRVTYQIKNYGKSPAWVTSAVMRFRIVVPRLEGPPDYGQRLPNFLGYILPPNEERFGERFLEGGSLTEEWRMRIVDGKAAELVVYGFFDYTDIFNDNKPPHRSGFAYKYNVGGGSDPGDVFVPTGPAYFWIYT